MLPRWRGVCAHDATLHTIPFRVDVLPVHQCANYRSHEILGVEQFSDDMDTTR